MFRKILFAFILEKVSVLFLINALLVLITVLITLWSELPIASYRVDVPLRFPEQNTKSNWAFPLVFLGLIIFKSYASRET